MASRNSGMSEMEKGMVDKYEVENKVAKLESLEKKIQGMDNLAFVDDQGEVVADGGDNAEIPVRRAVTFKRGQVVRTVEGFEPVLTRCSLMTEPARIPPENEDPDADEARPPILRKPPVPAEVSARRLASLKRTPARIVVPAGPIEAFEPIPTCSSLQDPKGAPLQQNLDAIVIADPGIQVPVPAPRVRVTYCPQQLPTRNFFGKNKLQIDLASQPVELPENIEINTGGNDRTSCNETRRRRLVQCGCVILAMIIILVMIFVQDKSEEPEKHQQI